MVELVEMSGTEYARIFSSPLSLFHSAAFNLLNSHKCQELKFLALLKGPKAKIGIVGGIKDSEFLSPFSAPFGGPQAHSRDVSEGYILGFPESLVAHLRKEGIGSARIVLPPMLYDSHLLSGVANGLFGSGFRVATYDLSYYFDLAAWDGEPRSVMNRSARKNLSISLRSNLSLFHCREQEDRAVCYDVIRRNRNEKGYPLRMTYAEVSKTAELVESDFVLVRDTVSGQDIAAAIVYRVAPSVAQVIYWGSLQDYHEHKPMNFLSYNLLLHLKRGGVTLVDVGPATQDSVPNMGLVQFKRSIGCRASTKMTFAMELS